MFTSIRFRIALFFSLACFCSLIIQGVVFLYVAHSNDITRVDANITRKAHPLILALESGDDLSSSEHFEFARSSLRLFDANGAPQFTGGLYRESESVLNHDPWLLTHGNETYRVLSYPLLRDGNVVGYLQVAGSFQPLSEILKDNTFFLVVQSGLITILLLVTGLWFERITMKPVQRAMMRMEQFAQNAGHELRTPLTNLRTSLDVAIKTGEYEHGIREAKEDSARLSKLIDSLLQLVTLTGDKMHITSVNLSNLLQSLVDEFRPRFEKKGVSLTVHVNDDVMVQADEALVRTACSNLIYNALKFTSKGNAVKVGVTQCEITVSDTGRGMSPEVAEHIFDRFYKAETSRSKKGFGLGLSLVKRICDLHDWNIFLDTEVEKGTMFTIEFPNRRSARRTHFQGRNIGFADS